MQINESRLLAEFLKLCRFSSPSRNERMVADYLIAELQQLGFSVREDETWKAIGGNTGNILAYKKGNTINIPTLMFSAHMDTVEPCENVQPAVKDGVVFSDGKSVLGGDDKAGIAGIMEALRVIRENNFAHGDLEIIFSVSEEVGITGAKHVDLSLLHYDYGYVLDAGGEPANIIVSAPAQDTFTVKIFGKACHAGSCPENGVNAILVAAAAMVKMRTGRIDEETTANIGAIHGGKVTNIVPDYVEVKCEARSRDDQKLVEQTKHMLEVFEKTADEFAARIEVEHRREYDSWKFSRDSLLLKLAVEGAEKMGLPIVFRDSGGGSDANIYNAKGRSTLVLGVGMDNEHSLNEKMRVHDLCGVAKHVLGIVDASVSQQI